MGLLSFTEDTEPARLQDSIKWKESPGAAEDPTPKPQKPETTKTKSPEGITSLSYDQVNNNAEELIELRGEGRYFGVTDPQTGDSINAQQSQGPLCDNCHKRGHIRSKCKTVICHKCGIVGDHYETQCPTTIVCARCGERGHIAGNCKSKFRKKQYCKSCDTFTHSDDNCPSIWRSYLTIPSKTELVLPTAYCYNCGGDTHYGDECTQQRTSRIPNASGSAFSGSNLPKQLRNAYFERIYGPPSLGKNGYSHGASKNDKRSFEAPSLKNYTAVPSRSGYLSAKTNGKKSTPNKPVSASRTGYLPKKSKGGVKPNRSGMMPKNGKKSVNFHQMY